MYTPFQGAYTIQQLIIAIEGRSIFKEFELKDGWNAHRRPQPQPTKDRNAPPWASAPAASSTYWILDMVCIGVGVGVGVGRRLSAETCLEGKKCIGANNYSSL